MEITYLSIRQMSERLKSGEISSLELTEAHLHRIHAINPRLRAIVHLAEESALRKARASDEQRAMGRMTGVLEGIPFTVKDWIEVADVPCIAGDERFRNHTPKQDATCVARLRKAGGVFLGKTSVFSDSAIYGKIYNPYNLALSPAGSSSGEASIIAAGGSPLGLGSDSGGSIRQPAHCCGIAGIRPTTGRIPLTGHLPRITALVDPRTVIGPMARSIEDLAFVLPILSGCDWRDASVAPVPLRDMSLVDLKKLRGVFYTDHAGANPSQVCVAAVQSAVHSLESLGIRMKESVPPRIEEAATITQDYWNRPESESDEEWVSEEGSSLSGDAIEKHLFLWDRFKRSMLAYMENVDFIVTPVAEQPARPHGQEGGIPYTLPYSLTGYPCVVVRVGTTAEGLPVGVQIVSPPWREDIALAVALALEQSHGGWVPPPI